MVQQFGWLFSLQGKETSLRAVDWIKLEEGNVVKIYRGDAEIEIRSRLVAENPVEKVTLKSKRDLGPLVAAFATGARLLVQRNDDGSYTLLSSD